ncbi:hypothetical protein, partial [Runella sp.]|uniref:hypothetical protein n=1 Tax=Runella sp. TaxID=1960881 RepID=UPI0030197ADC
LTKLPILFISPILGKSLKHLDLSSIELDGTGPPVRSYTSQEWRGCSWLSGVKSIQHNKCVILI